MITAAEYMKACNQRDTARRKADDLRRENRAMRETLARLREFLGEVREHLGPLDLDESIRTHNLRVALPELEDKIDAHDFA